MWSDYRLVVVKHSAREGGWVGGGLYRCESAAVVVKRWIGLSQRRGASLPSRFTPAEIPWRGSRRFWDATMTNVIIGGETMQPLSPGSAVAKFDESRAESDINYTPCSRVGFGRSPPGRSGPSHVSRTVCATIWAPSTLFTLQPLSRRTAALSLSLFPHRCLFTSPACLFFPSVRRPARPPVSHTNSGGCRSTLVPAEEPGVLDATIAHVLEQGRTSQDFPTDEPLGRLHWYELKDYSLHVSVLKNADVNNLELHNRTC